MFLNTEHQLTLPNFILFIKALSGYGHFPTFVHSAPLGVHNCSYTHPAAGWEEEEEVEEEEEEHPESDFGMQYSFQPEDVSVAESSFNAHNQTH